MNLEYVRAILPNGDIHTWSAGPETTITHEESFVKVTERGHTTELNFGAIPMITYKPVPL